MRQAYRYLLLGVAIALLGFSGMLVAIPSTDDFALDNPLWNGLSGLARDYGVRPVRASDAGNLPEDSVLLVVGSDKPFTAEEASSIRSYVARGGTLIVMDERGSGAGLLRSLGLPSPAGAALADRVFKLRNQYFPRVEVYLGGSSLEVFLNYGSPIEPAEGCIGFSSFLSYVDLDLDGDIGEGEELGSRCVASLHSLGRGRVYVFGDSSIFINSMYGLESHRELAELLLGGRSVYIVSDKWELDSYTRLRRLLAGSYSLAVDTSLRYPFAALLALACLAGGRYLYPRLLEDSEARGLEAEVERLAELHPGWDPGLLRRLAGEVALGGPGEADGGD